MELDFGLHTVDPGTELSPNRLRLLCGERTSHETCEHDFPQSPDLALRIDLASDAETERENNPKPNESEIDPNDVEVESFPQNIERKHYTEREITYNLLLRKLADEFLDRTLTYSHQPKLILNEIRMALDRNFPEFDENFHRERLCAYLKACRRNAKKNHGEPLVRISARYLSAGIAARLADQMFTRERANLLQTIKPSGSDCSRCIAPSDQSGTSPFTAPVQPAVKGNDTADQCPPTTFCQSLSQPTTIYPDVPPVQLQGTGELALAKLLGQTAEFLLLVADRLENGKPVFAGADLLAPRM